MGYHVPMIAFANLGKVYTYLRQDTNGWACISFAAGLTKIWLGFVPTAVCRFKYEKADDTSLDLNGMQSSQMKHKYFRVL